MSSRQRCKKDILELRKLVTKLVAELEQLKLAAGVNLDFSSSGSPNIVAAADMMKAAQWKHIAEIQFNCRLNSERENARLRSQLRFYVAQAKSFRRVANRKAQKSRAISPMEHNKLNNHGSIWLSSRMNTTFVFHELIGEMDTIMLESTTFLRRYECMSFRVLAKEMIEWKTDREEYSWSFLIAMQCRSVSAKLRR
ncbi:unnamed protein product [Phytophthora lilii]|uniref:Unnamed protein product n=1 Tax=Phytophthora lilii TaxID=2077276 RepID=A0A9W6TGM5_9STRA|nr:unnamed protein product [Phytophthora lilii]